MSRRRRGTRWRPHSTRDPRRSRRRRRNSSGGGGRALEPNAKIYVAGGRTLEGRAILGELAARGYSNIVNGTAGEPDLLDASQTADFFRSVSPEYVFLAGGKSGGIRANQKYPADLVRDNLLVECNVVHGAWRSGARKLLYLASSCSYPKDCPQPMRVESLLAGPPESTNEAYAIAKIAGIALCRAYRSQHGCNFIVGIPANVFGPGDDLDPEDSHVIPALIRKMHAANARGLESVEIWGTGAPRREFLYAKDLADACLFLMSAYDGPAPINIGSGVDLSIAELAGLVREVVGYRGRVRFDPSKPDGMPLKVLDSAALSALGWRAGTPFREALEATFRWILAEGKQTVPRGEDPGGATERTGRE